MKTQPRDWVLLLAIGIIWGSSFILMKRGLEVFDLWQVGAMRMGFALLACIPILIAQWRSIDSNLWLKLIVPGFFGNGIPAFLFTAAQTEVQSSLVGMLNSMVPLLTLVIGILFFKAKTNIWQMVGIGAGLVGAVLLLSVGGITDFKPQALLIPVAGVCYAINLNYVRSQLQGVPSTIVTAGAFVWCGVPCLLFLPFSLEAAQFDHARIWFALAAISVLAVVGTAVAVVLFNRLIGTAGPLFASMVTYVVPVVAMTWGVLDGETVASVQLIGIAVILTGVWLANRNRQQ